MNRKSETVEFQIKSSHGGAQEHLEKHPDIPVIVVEAGEKLDTLDQKMRKIFQDKLLDNEQG